MNQQKKKLSYFQPIIQPLIFQKRLSIKHLKIVLPFILKKSLKEHKNILIHCHAGRQRSLCALAAGLYVILDNNLVEIPNLVKTKDQGQNMKNVIDYIRIFRPQACSFGLRCNFKPSLERYFNIKF